MKQYDTFIFDSYEWNPDTNSIELRYSLDDEVPFVETLTLPPQDLFPRPMEPEGLDKALFALHLIGGISYFKTCLPKTIEIRSGSLSTEQAAFWNDVYTHGLGEFFYKNDIDFRGLINFPSVGEKEVEKAGSGQRVADSKKRVLVPIGGGKDSLVTVELLRHSGNQVTLFRMGQHPFIDTLGKVASMPLLTIKRALAPSLFRLNEEGALNGHVPITAYLSCVTVVMAMLYDFDAVALSNERSANEGNVEFKGMEINHQWSKSISFERAFQKYVKENISEHIDYFSLIRPFSELQITQILSTHVRYLEHFTSCNANWKILGEKQQARWCGKCPKCAFAFALMAAFLPKDTLQKIFGGILFDAEPLQVFYKELLGLEGVKPFECVGTPDETKAAFLLAMRKGDLKDTKAMTLFREKVLPTIKNADTLIKAAMTSSDDHAIPTEFANLLPKA